MLHLLIVLSYLNRTFCKELQAHVSLPDATLAHRPFLFEPNILQRATGSCKNNQN